MLRPTFQGPGPKFGLAALRVSREISADVGSLTGMTMIMMSAEKHVQLGEVRRHSCIDTRRMCVLNK